MTMSTETDKWQELMGTDLCMKILRHEDSDGEEDDANIEDQSVQLHDIVEIDWIGYYCDDATKRQLGIPPSATSLSDLANGSPPMAGTATPTHTNQNHKKHAETDTTKAISPSSSVLLSILNECPIFHSVQNLYCDVGDQDVIPAVEMGLRFLHIGVRRSRRKTNHSLTETVDEKEDPGIILPTVALIYSHSKYAYGISSRTYSTIIASDGTGTTTTTTTSGMLQNHNAFTLPSLSNVIYKVTLKRIVSSSTANVESPNALLQLFKCKKHLANDIYQNDILVTKKTRDGTTTADASHNQNHSNNSYHCHRAVRIYQRTVERLENWILELQNTMDDKDDDDPMEHHDREEENANIATATRSNIQEAQQLQIDCLNNISAVYLKCRLYHKAKEACIETLVKDANNIKALIRAAKAALYDPASSYEEVQAAFRAVQDIVAMADATRHDCDATLQKDLNVLHNEYVHHQAKYKREQKQMAVRIQEKLLTNRRCRPKQQQQQQQPRECPTDGTTNPASPASRTRSTITEHDDNTRETTPTTTTTTKPSEHPTLHNDTVKTIWTTWFERHIQLFTNVPKTTTELLCTAILPILLLWILCLYGFMGYLLYAYMPNQNHSE